MLKIVKGVPTAKVGMKVIAYDLDGKEIVGEVVEISQDVKNLITKIKVKGKDGYEIVEVGSLVVEAIEIIKKIQKSNVFKVFWAWFTGLFKKKNKN